MSYIVAFVRFPGSKLDYNVNCFRTDITTGEQVLVRLGDGRLRPGTVTRISYLDWDCRGRIECTRAEAARTPAGMVPPPGSPRSVGLVSTETMALYLRTAGWRPLKPSSHTYRVIYATTNGRDRANIWLRRRGVDVQVLEGCIDVPEPFASPDIGINDGRTVRHALAQTSFNLYEGIARFAEAFAADTRDYDRFFRPVGSKKRQTAEQMERFPASFQREEQGFEATLYEALGGDGGLAYVGDGLYLGADGSWHDG